MPYVGGTAAEMFLGDSLFQFTGITYHEMYSSA
jgi:hypothetical protein